ncbi:MAG: hypothetical protein E7456_03115 [Ruminococcaceae bacterium]|nr:hypothetical protein [Oscillospiraceae bacterium]
MIKALFRKQMMESFAWIYYNRKNGKRRDTQGIIVYAILYIILFGILGSMFFGMGTMLCEPLVSVGLGWLYFALISLVAIVLGVFGSVFNTYASLYKAKDNDMLLAMPIPASKILVMRLLGVYLIGLMYELIVMVPAIIVWFIHGQVNTLGVVFSIILPFVLSFFVLMLSCILGWVVALISSKVKNKSFVTVLLSLGFIGIYYYVYFRAYEMMANILVHAEAIAESVRSILYPFYHMGLAAEGKPLSMLIFTGIVAAAFGIVYFILSRSFLKLATTNKGGPKVRYREQAIKAGNADSALFKKELKRFTSSSTYMMNCGLGIIFMVIAAAALLIKGDAVVDVLTVVFGGSEGIVPLMMTAMLCVIITMNDISAPSVSLEGRNIWIVHVLPVSSWQVLKAKLKLHLVLTLAPAIILTACALIVFRPSVEFMVIIPVCVILFVGVMGLLGLVMNLKAPNLNWTNEVVPIKQSFSVTVALFGGWVIVIAFGALYLAVDGFVSPVMYLVAVSVILLAASVVMYMWLKNKGAKIFASL